MTPPVVISNRLPLNSWGWRLTGRGTPRPTPDPAALHHTGVTTLTVTRQNVTPVRPTAAPGPRSAPIRSRPKNRNIGHLRHHRSGQVHELLSRSWSGGDPRVPNFQGPTPSRFQGGPLHRPGGLPVVSGQTSADQVAGYQRGYFCPQKSAGIPQWNSHRVPVTQPKDVQPTVAKGPVRPP